MDPFNYDTMKKMLLEKLDSFAAAPFTIQRISELLSDPRKQYSRIDKFMRAVEKTILVVSTVPPGRHRSESENGDSLDSAMNGDFSAEVNVDVDMEQDGKEVNDVKLKSENQVAAGSTQETLTITKNVSPSKSVEVGASTEDEKALPEIKVEGIPTVLTSTADATSPVKSEIPAEAPKRAEAPAESSLEGEIKPVTTQTTPEISSEAVVVEPKIDEALLNEPIRPADNEILVDTSEISSETTPLAALENIVAIRTEAGAIEQVEPQANPTVLVNLEPEAKASKEEPAPFEPEDEPEVEAKKIKLSEVPECSAEAPVTESVETEKLEKLIDEVADETPAEPVVVIAPTVEGKIPEVVASPKKIADESAAVVEATVVEKIDEPVPEIAEILIETAAPAAAEIVETASTEMETVPIIAENKMSLDEDEPPANELEMTPIANKMDTDESAPMDFEDDAEPMDQ